MFRLRPHELQQMLEQLEAERAAREVEAAELDQMKREMKGG